MDSADAARWFEQYLDAFAACARGEQDPAELLAFYGLPLVVTTDGGAFGLTTDADLVAMLQRQIDGLRGEGYRRSEVIAADVTVLNSSSALMRETISRQRSDGSEISRLVATYLVADTGTGRRISMLAVEAS